jgi:hypothetical protein
MLFSKLNSNFGIQSSARWRLAPGEGRRSQRRCKRDQRNENYQIVLLTSLAEGKHLSRCVVGLSLRLLRARDEKWKAPDRAPHTAGAGAGFTDSARFHGRRPRYGLCGAFPRLGRGSLHHGNGNHCRRRNGRALRLSERRSMSMTKAEVAPSAASAPFLSSSKS